MNAFLTRVPGGAPECEQTTETAFTGPQTRPAAQPTALGRGELHSVVLEFGETVLIEGQQGLCWVTMEGDPVDYAVEAGNTLRLQGPGLLLIEGMQAANRMKLDIV